MSTGIALVSGLCLASLAQAEPALYEIPTSGVVCAGTAAHAEAAVRKTDGVQTVEADPAAHTVVARFDDEVTSVDALVEALEEAGLGTGEPKRLN